MGEKMPSQNKLIAVAIDKDRGSQFALKWTVDNLLVRGQTTLLIHVKSPPLASPRSNQIYDEARCRNFSELDLQTKEMFLPLRVFCTRKDVSIKL
ncbi:hypothetical protein A4A49_12883 [Nicotiana attenuata]|uniref:RING-type E3 ubiquitin transferase n=1 Tax=Nicotiana attenuata TaxID=49451 RepID=A0A314LCM2_NICAT|nr:hypothetical protein A4A49_12883 [Nicotiana attenuata]